MQALATLLLLPVLLRAGTADTKRDFGTPGWSTGPGPYPLWLCICASRAINRQSIGNM